MSSDVRESPFASFGLAQESVFVGTTLVNNEHEHGLRTFRRPLPLYKGSIKFNDDLEILCFCVRLTIRTNSAAGGKGTRALHSRGPDFFSMVPKY